MLAIAAAIALTTAGIGTYATAANDIGAEWDHFTSCFDFMVNAPPRHERTCLPNRVKIDMTATMVPSGSSTPATLPSPT